MSSSEVGAIENQGPPVETREYMERQLAKLLVEKEITKRKLNEIILGIMHSKLAKTVAAEPDLVRKETILSEMKAVEQDRCHLNEAILSEKNKRGAA